MSKFWVSINFLLFFSIQHHFANSLPNSTAIGGGHPIWAKKQQQLRPKGKGTSSRENRVLANKDNVILDQLLKNYDQRIRPPKLFGKNETAVRVSVNILIRMLSKIDVVNMEYSLQITFREQWVDGRLAYRDMGLPNLPKFLTVPHVKAKIWFPDTFFPTEKNAHRHMLDTENMFVRIYPDGTVLYSSRLSLVCSCPMHLQLYPLDVQYCDFDLISYAHTTTDIVYEWASTEPVQLKAGVGQDLPNFHLDPVIDTGIECTSHTNTGTYACLRMRMRLSRLMTYFVLQLYIPTSLVVCVSLVSFWIDMHSTAGRVALAIMTLLTITTMQSSINAKLPPVNYVKVVDVWLGACQAFVFSALIEYAVVCYRDSALRNSQRRETEMRLAQRRKSIAAGGLTIDDGPFDAKLPPPPEQQWLDWATGERSALPEDEDNLPCTCELGGIGSAVLATLGMVPLSGNVISTSLLLPIAATAENSKVRRRSIGGRRNGAGGMHQQKHAQFQVLELKKQRRPFWTWLKKKLRKPDYLPARIDYYARIWMPIGFLVFNCAYWTICLIMASQQQMRAKN